MTHTLATIALGVALLNVGCSTDGQPDKNAAPSVAADSVSVPPSTPPPSEGAGATSARAACDLVARWADESDDGLLGRAVVQSTKAAAADDRLQTLATDIRAVDTHMAAGNDAYSDSVDLFAEVGAPQTPTQAAAMDRAQTEWDAAGQAMKLVSADCEVVGAPFTVS